jgi:hypothetical protein
MNNGLKLVYELLNNAVVKKLEKSNKLLIIMIYIIYTHIFYSVNYFKSKFI